MGGCQQPTESWRVSFVSIYGPPSSLPSASPANAERRSIMDNRGHAPRRKAFGCPNLDERPALGFHQVSFRRWTDCKATLPPHAYTERVEKARKRREAGRETSKPRRLRCTAGYEVKRHIPDQQHRRRLMKSTTADLHAALHTEPGESWTTGPRPRLLRRGGFFPSRLTF